MQRIRIALLHQHVQISRSSSSRSSSSSAPASATSNDPTSPLIAQYKHLVDTKLLNYDAKQHQLLLRLDQFRSHILATHEPRPKTLTTTTSGNRLGRLFAQLLDSRQRAATNKWSSEKTRGIYLYGGVGCGKTMLMDMVYNSLPAHVPKQRLHFNKFMLAVHADIHRIKVATNYASSVQPIVRVADELSDRTRLLFFDEFMVTDIADAMLMQRLFGALFERGLVLVSTSNRAPGELYKNGLQRELFLPFIDHVLPAHCDIVCLDSTTDYRRVGQMAARRVYFNSEFESHLLDATVARLLGEDGSTELSERVINVLGREIRLEAASDRLLVASYAFMCEEARSAVDYLEMCRLFDVVIVRDIPMIETKAADSLRRFITLVDTLYDQRCMFVASGKASAPQFLFVTSTPQSHNSADSQQQPKQQRASLFTLEEEHFAIDRTISRLVDMQTESYYTQWLERVEQRRPGGAAA